MKILFFSPYFFPYISGLALYPYRLFLALSQKNNITVLTFLHDTKLPRNEKVKNLTIKRMTYWFKISKGYISISSLYTFLKECLTHEVVILNLPNVEGLSLALMAFCLRKKIITIYHCNIITKGAFGFLLQLIVNLSTYIQLLLSTNIVSHDDYATNTLPSYVQHKLIHTYPMRDQFLTPDNKMAKILRQEKYDNIWIGFAGRIASEKGLEYLIDAVSHLYQHNMKIQLVLCGPHPNKTVGEQKYQCFIMDKIKTNSFPVKQYHDLDSARFYAVLKTLDVLVTPSVNETEAFGLTQIEAMTLGTPVVATDLFGVRTPILKTGMGILVKPKQTKQIETAISAILNNRLKYSNDKLIQKAVKEFDPVHTISAFESIINN